MATALIDHVAADAMRAWAPPPRLTVSEWADEYRMLPKESSAEPGRWRTDRAPYQRGIMDAVNDSSVREIVVMTSAQVGKTELLLNTIGYFVSHDPSSILVLQPTLDMAEAFSKDRLAPMVRDTPILTGKIADPRARDSGNTLLHKKFPGGQITMAGANSPASLASRPIRTVLCDEVDRYPASAGSEGDPVNLAKKRTTTFWNRKILLTSTPTVKGLSRIEAAFQASDQRRYHVPCPHCGAHQVMKWANVRWDEGRPETARYYCEACGERIEPGDKLGMLLRGEWRATAPFNGIAGFHLSELYSPWRSWGEVARDFIEAKHAGHEQLKTWVNTALGEPWEEQGDSIEDIALLARLEDYPERLHVAITTAGVDVQKDRIEASIVAWGQGEEAWLIDHIVLPGDTARPEVWEDLDEALKDAGVQYAAIDSGFNTSMVYAFVEKKRWAVAVKGVTGMGRPLIEDERKRRQRLRYARKKAVRVEPLGVDQGKTLIYARLKLTQTGAGYIHFPREPAFDEEYFAQLAAEKLVTKFKGSRPFQEWVQTRPRNEALDCLMYALAAMRLSGKRLDLKPEPSPTGRGQGEGTAVPPQTQHTTIAGRRARFFVQQ